MLSDKTVVRAEALQKFYGPYQALQDINLDVKKGERVVICGPSGSGKSTLVRCFNGLEFHDSGLLEVAGVIISRNSPQIHRLRQKVGMVFQNFNLFPHLTILENLTLGPVKVKGHPKAEAEENALKYLERVHILEQKDKYPAQLSGGQQQRVAIARCLCMENEIMIFDEPTSALDPEMIREVLDVIVELADTGVTMICVTHEMGFARRVADKMIFMDVGQIVESAPPDVFFENAASERCQRFLDRILRH